MDGIQPDELLGFALDPRREADLGDQRWVKGVPIEVTALILGHEDIATTYAFYLHADMRAAEQAISLVAPPQTKPGRYRAPDPLLAFLEGL